MKTSINNNPPEFKYNEYLIIINPNQDTCDKINFEKKEFSEKYKTDLVYFKPHILMVKFIHLEMIEERLLNQLRNISNGYQTFQVKLKDFGSFPSHTIFINVETQLQVRNLVTALKSVQRIMTLDKENKPHFLNNYYFNIAARLLPWQYEKAWVEYSHRHFNASFIAEGFTLLKRPVENFSNGFQPKGSYKILQRFKFMNLPVIAQQGELFI